MLAVLGVSWQHSVSLRGHEAKQKPLGFIAVLCWAAVQRETTPLQCLFVAVRFKEHIQNNLPRDFLTTEQFVQLRRELAAASGHSSEDGDELPCGTEDITDPAKVPAGLGTEQLSFPGAGQAFPCSQLSLLGLAGPRELLHSSALWHRGHH